MFMLDQLVDEGRGSRWWHGGPRIDVLPSRGADGLFGRFGECNGRGETPNHVPQRSEERNLERRKKRKERKKWEKGGILLASGGSAVIIYD